MGDDPKTSVVDASQRSHDVQNLWIVGSGSFPTVVHRKPDTDADGAGLQISRQHHRGAWIISEN